MKHGSEIGNTGKKDRAPSSHVHHVKNKRARKKKKRKIPHGPGHIFIKSFVSHLIHRCRNSGFQNLAEAAHVSHTARGQSMKGKKKGQASLPNVSRGKKAVKTFFCSK